MLIRTSQTHAMDQSRCESPSVLRWHAYKLVDHRYESILQGAFLAHSGGVEVARRTTGTEGSSSLGNFHCGRGQIVNYGQNRADLAFRTDVACPKMAPGENGVHSPCRPQGLRNKRSGGRSGRLLQCVLGKRPQCLASILRRKRTAPLAVGPCSRNEAVRTGSVGR